MAGTDSTRWWRHLITEEATVRRLFGTEGLDRITRLIAEGERTHRGQVRFAIEAALPLRRVWHGITARERALEVFSLSRTWDTEENCGVLIYLLIADRCVEIVADRGIHERVGDATWAAICDTMKEAFRRGDFYQGAEAGVRAVNGVLATHFPATGAGKNELPDAPLVL